MAEESEAERTARLDAESAQRKTNFGTLLVFVALLVVVLQGTGSNTEYWPYVLAGLLTVFGVGLRIEGAVRR